MTSPVYAEPTTGSLGEARAADDEAPVLTMGPPRVDAALHRHLEHDVDISLMGLIFEIKSELDARPALLDLSDGSLAFGNPKPVFTSGGVIISQLLGLSF